LTIFTAIRRRDSSPAPDCAPEQEEIAVLNESLLARVRLWTILLALPVAGACWPLLSGMFALGLIVTALWAVAGFYILERLLRAAVVPPGTPRNGFAVFLWLMGKLAVYGLAVWVLFSRPFPALSHATGLTLLIAVLVVQGARARSRENRDHHSTQQIAPENNHPDSPPVA